MQKLHTKSQTTNARARSLASGFQSFCKTVNVLTREFNIRIQNVVNENVRTTATTEKSQSFRTARKEEEKRAENEMDMNAIDSLNIHTQTKIEKCNEI